MSDESYSKVRTQLVKSAEKYPKRGLNFEVTERGTLKIGNISANNPSDDFTDILNCEATTIISKFGGVKIGDKISFNKDRSTVTGQVELAC